MRGMIMSSLNKYLWLMIYYFFIRTSNAKNSQSSWFRRALAIETTMESTKCVGTRVILMNRSNMLFVWWSTGHRISDRCLVDTTIIADKYVDQIRCPIFIPQFRFLLSSNACGLAKMVLAGWWAMWKGIFWWDDSHMGSAWEEMITFGTSQYLKMDRSFYFIFVHCLPTLPPRWEQISISKYIKTSWN